MHRNIHGTQLHALHIFRTVDLEAGCNIPESAFAISQTNHAILFQAVKGALSDLTIQNGICMLIAAEQIRQVENVKVLRNIGKTSRCY